MNIDHDSTPNGMPGTPLITLMLWSISFFLHTVSMFTFDTVYTWTYRILSALLLLIGLYINLPKAIKQWKKENKEPEEEKAE